MQFRRIIFLSWKRHYAKTNLIISCVYTVRLFLYNLGSRRKDRMKTC